MCKDPPPWPLQPPPDIWHKITCLSSLCADVLLPGHGIDSAFYVFPDVLHVTISRFSQSLNTSASGAGDFNSTFACPTVRS